MALADFNLGDVGNIFTSIREAITGKRIVDPIEMQKLENYMEGLENAIQTGQIEINKIEAKSTSLFIAGWRPFLGWVGGFAIAYTFIVQPFMWWCVKLYIAFSQNVLSTEQLEALKPVVLDTSLIFNLVLALLGFGGMRTYEKFKKVEHKR